MSTYMAKPETVQRSWYIIDAAGKPLGKTAVTAANILRGKHRPEFTPHVDCGEFVIIINCDQGCPHRKEARSEVLSYITPATSAVLRRHLTSKLMSTKPEFAMELAVKGMLPHNSIGDKAITRLKVYAGSEHKHAGSEARSVRSLKYKKG